jgi:hypothetical protein
VLRQRKDGHALRERGAQHLLQRVAGVARAKLAGVAVVGEGHFLVLGNADDDDDDDGGGGGGDND